ncbi:hypothetical protein [Amycolatopsis orientalis]|uniref:hypothetical protein n=1 Tax=Amycolatopsis orientalis TaxID=31958 RepID=UPI00040AB9A2|nr:hypothetical protein [Amycolatopsis orientalis]
MVEQDRIGDEAGSIGERRSRVPWLVGLIVLVILLVGGLVLVGARALAPTQAAEEPPPPPLPFCAVAQVKVAEGKPVRQRLPEPVVTLPTGCRPPDPAAAVTFADVVVGTGPEKAQGSNYLAFFALYDLASGEVIASNWQPRHQYDGLSGGAVEPAGGLWSSGLAGMKPGGRRVLLLPAVLGERAQDPVEMYRSVPLVAVVDVL